MDFKDNEIKFYEKNLKLKEISKDGQNKLRNSRVLVLGAGGLGCPALLYLATSGVGKIGIVDFDTVSVSNLHRQILYTYEDLGKSKAITAKKKLQKINPFIEIEAYNLKILENNIEELIKDYDIILDSPDNFETRYIIERACTKQKKIVVHASVSRFQGQVTVFTPETGCYNCLFPDTPSEAGVEENKENMIFGPVTGIIGTMQAIETLKVILNIGKISTNNLICYNSLDNSVKKFKFSKRKDCPVCGEMEGENN